MVKGWRWRIKGTLANKDVLGSKLTIDNGTKEWKASRECEDLRGGYKKNNKYLAGNGRTGSGGQGNGSGLNYELQKEEHCEGGNRLSLSRRSNTCG